MKPVAPERFGQHGHRSGVTRLFFRKKPTAGDRRDAQGFKRVGGDIERADALGLARPGQRGGAFILRDHMVEDPALVSPKKKLWIRYGDVADVRIVVLNHYEPVS